MSAAATVYSTIWGRSAEEVEYMQPIDRKYTSEEPLPTELLRSLHAIAWQANSEDPSLFLTTKINE